MINDEEQKSQKTEEYQPTLFQMVISGDDHELTEKRKKHFVMRGDLLTAKGLDLISLLQKLLE